MNGEHGLRIRDGETIADGVTFHPILHGLRSTAVVQRRMAGYSDELISNDIGMSLAMVIRYSRFMDQKAAAQINIVRLEEARKLKGQNKRERVDRRKGNP